MKQRPILFSAPMVRALLDGSKRQTRRVVKPQPASDPCFECGGTEYKDVHAVLSDGRRTMCLYGHPGDRLWVRERFRALECREIDYFADGKEVWERMQDHLPLPDAAKWKPSIHMPRWASRITLEITGVRVERLQDISESDARAEGITDGGCTNCGNPDPCGCSNPSPDARDAYCNLWGQINGEQSWHENPWVWVIEFKRLESA